ncbi:polysaccharide lyase 8 family protein [Mucilaginibacter terrae]|uniref:polysaccharide lyase 8 family protein n=1 Tax=Mucilaginibacter terrae TaxID=1955052 RepID=UPI0036432CD6
MVNFDALRNRWYNFLTGDGLPGKVDARTQVTDINTTANTNWESMIKADTRTTHLWPDLRFTSSADITSSYKRLQEMALAYCTSPSSLYHNANLKADIIAALDWLYQNQYNEQINVPSTGGINNWWDYRIGVPNRLNNILILFYNELTPAQRQNYIKVIDHCTPELKRYTGANLVWVCRVSILSGIISKSESKITRAVEALPLVFDYVTVGDGFYTDGSFIQHSKHPYTGAYGASLLISLSELLYLFSAQHEIQIPLSNNLFEWIDIAFKPIIYRGGFMSMTMGREIARPVATEHFKGKAMLEAMLLLAQVAPANQAGKLKSLIKYYVQSDNTYPDYKTALSGIVQLKLLSAIMDDKRVRPSGSYQIYRQFANMDRVVQHTAKYAFGVSMHSSRILNYESINQENLKAWNTSSGMTYLYNADQQQYNDNFWPTVNFHHLPGTTVVEGATASPGKTSTQSWVGGAGIYGKYGVTGMHLAPFGTVLSAKKSWFMFDNEVVALGASITNGNTKPVYTYIEQRKLLPDNSNTVTVNGKPITQLTDTTAKEVNVNWAHITGNVKGADVGYYFPGSTAIKVTRQLQTGRWSDINKIEGSDSVLRSAYYLTISKSHNQANTLTKDAQYAYVILPGFLPEQVKAYSVKPDITILSNTANLQAVKENKLNIIAANFWTDSLTTLAISNNKAYITCNKKAAVLVGETEEVITISLADPTMENNGTVEVYIHNNKAVKVILANKQIKVKQIKPVIQLVFDVNGAKGKTNSITLSKK